MQRRGGATTPARGLQSEEPQPIPESKQDYQYDIDDSGLLRGWDTHFTVTLIFAAMMAVVTYFGLQKLEKLEQGEDALSASLGVTPFLVYALFCTLTCCTSFCFCGRRRSKRVPVASLTPADYTKASLGSTADMDPKQLYLDMVKRGVCNILYQDRPQWLYDNRKQPFLASDFELQYRSRGEDFPTSAHTMVGLKRLQNVQDCVMDVVANNVPGDLVETGVFRGGTVVFMKACLRVAGAEDRKVYACDTFNPQKPSPAHADYWAMPAIRAFASVPGSLYRRGLVECMQRAAGDDNSFPVAENMSDNTVDIGMFLLRNAGNYNEMKGTGMDEVQETFAKYGLLDDNVKFLKGFFSDTLPKADIEQVSVLRLDGDTYESTITGLEPLYDKVSVGGYIIVDDYNSLSDCQKAIDEFRENRGITDPLIPIDNLSVYWQKSA